MTRSIGSRAVAVSVMPVGMILTQLLVSPGALGVPAPPGVVVIMSQPSASVVNLGGTLRLDMSNTPAPTGFVWHAIWLDVYNSSSVLVERGAAQRINTTECYYACPTSLHVNGNYTVRAWGQLKKLSDNSICDVPLTPPVPVEIENPTVFRHTSKEQLECVCQRDCVPTGSSTSPLSGHQSWEIPLSTWEFHGRPVDFSLTYHTGGIVDAQAPRAPDFSGLSEVNSRWSHNFASWIDLYQTVDETDAEYAVWHINGITLAFRKSGSGFVAPYSGLELSFELNNFTPPAIEVSDPFPSGGGTQTLTPVYRSFSITMPDGMRYEFNKSVPTGQDHLYWKVDEKRALPHYLLSRVSDRHDRTVSVTWTLKNVRGVMEPRVTEVRDGSNFGVVLDYPDASGLLDDVTEVDGATVRRVHDLTYTQIADENGQGYYKLTGVSVKGPGSPHQVTHNWLFEYRIPSTELGHEALTNERYGGTPTGDLVLRKTAPHGVRWVYKHEQVALTELNGFLHRIREIDWQGRVLQVTWPDGTEDVTGDGVADTVTKAITRTWNMPTRATMTWPSPPLPAVQAQTQFDYTNGDVTKITDVPTGRAWEFTYHTNGRHDLTSVKTPVEAGGAPLVQYDYMFDAAQRIKEVLARYRKDDGSLGSETAGDATKTEFNVLNLPTLITAFARPVGGNAHQVTQLCYDSHANCTTLTVGNLYRVTEAMGTPQQQETLLSYAGPAGTWGLPTSIQNEVGAVSSLTYEATRGWPLTFSSPVNVAVGVGSPDYLPSTVTTGFPTAANADHLPNVVVDPEGHQVGISYSAPSAGSPDLVITFTFNDGYTRKVVLDGAGRPKESKDERDVWTAVTFNPQDQVTGVTRNATDPDPNMWRLTKLSYDGYGDLRWFDPPGGSSGRVRFYTNRWVRNMNYTLTETAIPERQTTRILHADGRNEYFGYNGAGEPAWQRKSSGAFITVATRDALHRATKIDFPAEHSQGAFSVTAAYDEFGRMVSSSDNTGATTLAWDVLNRPTSIVPPSPQKALTFTYSKDLALKRWTTNMDVGGGLYQFREDTKGRIFETVNPFSQTFKQEYDLDGKPRLTTWPNKVKEERTYTPRDFLASLQIRRGDLPETQQELFQYFSTSGLGVYDPTGHLQREVDAGNKTHAFFYNNLYEMTGETHPDLGTVGYTYGKNGSRLTRTQNGATDYYGVTADNRLIWVHPGSNTLPTRDQPEPYTLFNYNMNGQVERRDRRFTKGGPRQDLSLLWDGDDRLREVRDFATGTPVFKGLYADDGLRVRKEDMRGGPLQVRDFSWAPGGLYHEQNSTTGVATTYTPGFAQRQGTTDRFFHVDWLGSTRTTSDSSGVNFPQVMRFDAYGQRSATTGTDAFHATDMQFAGDWGYQTEWASATDPGLGLQYLQQRYYDRSVGRFLSPDPISFLGGLNLYSYVGNDPVNMVDPTGLFELKLDLYIARELAKGNIREAADFAVGAYGRGHQLWAAATATILGNRQVQSAIMRATQPSRLRWISVERGRLPDLRIPHCESFARAAIRVLDQLGITEYEVLQVVPRAGERFIPLTGGGSFWAQVGTPIHVVIRYGNTIIDSLTRGKPLPYEEWVKLLQYGAEFNRYYRLDSYTLK